MGKVTLTNSWKDLMNVGFTLLLLSRNGPIPKNSFKDRQQEAERDLWYLYDQKKRNIFSISETYFSRFH